jgi:hypothetical protein
MAPEPGPEIDTDQLRGFTTSDIESFRAKGIEVKLESVTCGPIWLVPAYTGQARREITPEHAATIARVLSLFPGTRVVAFELPGESPPPPTAEAGNGT